MKNENSKKAVPAKLTVHESRLVDQCICLNGWQFDETIKKKCTQIHFAVLGWVKKYGKKERQPEHVYIYGLECQSCETGQSLIANFFVYHEGIVYQSLFIDSALNIVKILQKQFDWKKYQDAQDRIKEKNHKKNCLIEKHPYYKKSLNQLLIPFNN